MFNELDHANVNGLTEIQAIFKRFGCSTVLIKKLARNNNDKNQVYFHHNPDLLNSLFDLTFGYREKSRSAKKNGRTEGSQIAEAVFNNFSWISSSGTLHRVPHCKGILYAQYPEVRLSGFRAESGIMPYSMSIAYVKSQSKTERFLAIGADVEGRAFGLMLVDPQKFLYREFLDLPYFAGSKICRHLQIEFSTASDQLRQILALKIAGKDVKGCRLTATGETRPFTATQVHGYTLEHELGIASNASKEGDFRGIELKCYTQPKLTLFTPEPDGGLYAESFEKFMMKYGYSKETVYRFTGIHRVGSIAERSGLSLVVLCSPKGSIDGSIMDYDVSRPFHDQLTNLHVSLLDDENQVAASWSLTRLLNNWGVKHNEVVYIPASVKDNDVIEEFNCGFTKRVWFGREFLWCKKTSLEKMIHAIAAGVIFLDPAPKLNPEIPKENKRRSQWRVNDIRRDSKSLYESVEIISL
jgi:hypothetical protein